MTQSEAIRNHRVSYPSRHERECQWAVEFVSRLTKEWRNFNVRFNCIVSTRMEPCFCSSWSAVAYNTDQILQVTNTSSSRAESCEILPSKISRCRNHVLVTRNLCIINFQIYKYKITMDNSTTTISLRSISFEIQSSSTKLWRNNLAHDFQASED